MSNAKENVKPGGTLPKAKIAKTRRSWYLWLIPLGALALCVWFIYRDYIATGPLITIYFTDADGLEENNTQLKYLGSTVGEVKTLRLARDNKSVEVKARLAGPASRLAREGSVFWIVRPEVKVGAISGLRTIISGEYIAVRPGNGPRTNRFVGADKEPVAEEPHALNITLLALNLGSLQERSPISYRAVQVGEVQGFQLANDAQEVKLNVRIHEAYAPLVRANSKFWNAGGLNFSFGLFRGAEISAESAKTLLSGGIEFATPTEAGEVVTNGAVFRLYDKPEDAWKNWMPVINLKLTNQAAENVQPPPMNLK